MSLENSRITTTIRRWKSRTAQNTFIGSPMLSIGLPHPLEDPRVLASVEPYPGRWTHHIALTDEAEIDDELIKWIDAAYEFPEGKR